MLGLKVAVVVMGILIVAGVAVLGVTLATRMSGSGGPIASVLLDEPGGTRVVGATLSGDRIAVQLQGGGADRVVLVDTKAGRVLGALAWRADGP